MYNYNYYILDDFNEVLRYFDTHEAARLYLLRRNCHGADRIYLVDLYEILGDCLL
jgi:hypothetical protein